MPSISIDNVLGPLPSALRVRSDRAAVLASNLANADTPGFQARDLDFGEALELAKNDLDRSTVLRTKALRDNHIEIQTRPSESTGQRKYRTPLVPAVDGNTVDAQIERAEMNKNNVQLAAAVQFLDGRVRGLRTAITGE